MTVQKSLKRRVRARMAKTGERYAAARRNLLGIGAGTDEPTAPAEAEAVAPADALARSADAASPADPRSASASPIENSPGEAARPEPPKPAAEPGMSDEALSRRTGKGWAEWFAILDAWGAANRTHPEIATYLREELGVDGWWAQSITVGYERARGRRVPGQLVDGYSTNASKTVAVPVDRLYAAFADPALRAQWLPDAPLTVTTATSHKAVRGAWESTGRLDAGFTAKGDAKSSVAIQLRRLPDARSAERLKAYWRERLAALADLLEG